MEWALDDEIEPPPPYSSYASHSQRLSQYQEDSEEEHLYPLASPPPSPSTSFGRPTVFREEVLSDQSTDGSNDRTRDWEAAHAVPNGIHELIYHEDSQPWAMYRRSWEEEKRALFRAWGEERTFWIKEKQTLLRAWTNDKRLLWKAKGNEKRELLKAWDNERREWSRKLEKERKRFSDETAKFNAMNAKFEREREELCMRCEREIKESKGAMDRQIQKFKELETEKQDR